MSDNRHYDAIVIGAGPAGLTAGIYLSRARLRTLIVNEGVAGDSTAKRFRQITTAVADGTIAALAASQYLNELKIKQKQLITY